MLDAHKNKGRPLPYLRNPNVRWFEVDTSDLQEMPFEDHELERYGLQEGDVLVCEGGEAGRAAIWDGRLPNIKFQKAIHRVRPGPELFNRYLVHRLRVDYHENRLSDYYTGATIKHLTGQDLARYEFPLPPLAEQRRIATILDQADILRAKRRAALAQLDTLTRSFFRSRFGDLDRREPLGILVDEFRYGTSLKSGPTGYPALRIPNVIGGGLDLGDLKLVPVEDAEFRRLQLQGGDLLFVRTNGNPDFVGRCATFEPTLVEKTGLDPSRFIYASYLIRARIKSRLLPRVLQEFLSTSDGRRELRSRTKTSAGQYNINTESLASVPVPVPPLPLQRKFLELVGAVERSKSSHRSSLAYLDALFASLQRRAFRGGL